jgi:uncharacterized protein YndB with AHSA1/START domain
MANKLEAKASVTLNAPTSKVWKALTDPAQIKQYMFGTDTKSDWKQGSPITYTGEWEGKKYEDKGVIKEIIPEKLLHTTYLSSMSGKEDKPENYANVIYSLEPKDGKTVLKISQDNNDTEESKEHSQKNWEMVLDSIKKLVEK